MDFSFKSLTGAFFDTTKVQDALEKKAWAVMGRYGAFVRRRMQTSIRPRKGKTAPPGKPPFSHEGSLRELILFALDPHTRFVVIGPVAFRRGEAPGLLERGGAVIRKRKDGSARRMNYRGNPFVAPAGLAEAKNFRELLRGVVR